MGAVAIWCMHFIGNRAIQMLNGERELQIEYSSPYTAGSFFLPICVLGLDFYCFNQTEDVTVRGTILGGVMAGLAVCGMHYTGQVGISNYTISYLWKCVVGSVFIAIAANTAALGVFFYFTMTWTNSLWKKIGCALMLAASVSGMHWVATVGTIYRFAGSSSKNDLPRKGVVIIVLCLGIGCCMILLFLAVIGNRLKRQYAHRAQQVVLACATFDPEGRLMVTPEGLLPCRKITNSYIESSFEEVFDISHPAFCWVFRASHCWQGVAGLIPAMRAHLRASSVAKAARRESTSTFSDTRSITTTESPEDYSSLFKELFCVAAQDLATLVRQPLEKMGVLFEGIMNTGTVRKAAPGYIFRQFTSRNSLNDSLENHIEAAERGRANIVFGRGQLLFVVRGVNRADSTQIQALGYRFASITNVIGTLARSMQVTKEELSPYLENIQKHTGKERILDPGVHVACFALRPRYQRGFEVAVRRDARNLLPTYPLPLSRLERSHTDILNHMDNWTVVMCCDWLRDQSLSSNGTDLQFYSQLLESIEKLTTQIENPFFHEARLVARPFNVPRRVSSTNHALNHALVIAFRTIVDAHQYTTINESFMFAPSSFFLCQQHIYPKSPDHPAFARRIHRELAALAQYIERKDVQSVKSYPRKSFQCIPRVHLDFMRRDGASSAAGKRFSLSSLSTTRSRGKWADRRESMIASENSTFGGILVSNEITIDAADAERGENSPDIETAGVGVRTEVGVAALEHETFADQLMALTIDERRHASFEDEFRLD